MRSRTRLLALMVSSLPYTLSAAPLADDLDRLLDLSIEQLAEVEVVSPARRAMRLGDIPASVFVIHRDDIRTLGIRSLPEALRLAPNLHVARINAASHAVSARGMKTSLSNKLLVMIDGRPIYTPLFAGVLWDMQAVPLEDVDRIEVVSGPGAAAWGANAVNGVINIVTRSATATTGGAVRGWLGEDGHALSARQGFDIGSGAVRVYAMRDRIDGSETAGGVPVPDGWTQQQAGFRSDTRHGDAVVRLQGDVFRAESQPRAGGPIEADGHNLVGHWSRATSDGGSWSVQGYLDVVDRRDPLVLTDRLTIVALEMMRSTAVGAHRLNWGLGYRHGRDRSRPGALARLIPADRDLHWAHAFLHDQFDLGERVSADLGVRLDSNVYTGVEVLPSVRLSWRTDHGGLVWAALSRAVRAPARFDRDLFFPVEEPFIFRGGPDFESEVSKVAELGYRAQPTAWLSLSVTAFHHWHDRLRGGEPAPGGGLFIANRIEGRVWGAEGWLTARAAGDWEVALGFLELRQHFESMSGTPDPAGVRDQGNDPRRQVLLRTTQRIGQRQQISAFARYVGELPNPRIDDYVQVDARWSFTPTDAVDIGIGVQNVFDDRHTELQPAGGLQPSTYGRVAFVDARVGW